MDKKQWLEQRKLKGMCLQCDKPSGPRSKLYCDSCSDKFIVNSQKRQEALKELGLCLQCMKPSKSNRCSDCVSKNNAARRNAVIERQTAGLCVKCGKEKSVSGNTRCTVCCLKHSAWTYLKATNKWKELKEVFDKQQGVCPFTGRSLTVGIDTEIDHIVPRSCGGGDNIENLQWVHKDVNRMKSDKMESEFLELIAEIFDYRLNH